jgi:large subunit ribosomal protein L23
MIKDSEIIIKPLIFSEKANTLKDEHGKYVFLVNPKANKVEIKKAVEKLFGVKVRNVRTMITRGHVGRMGFRYGKRPNRKKAIVTLEEDQKIEIFG